MKQFPIGGTAIRALFLGLASLPIACATRVPGTGAPWPDPPRREWTLPPGSRVDWSGGLSRAELLAAVEASPEMQERLYDFEIEGRRRRAVAEMGSASGLEFRGARQTRTDRTAIGGGMEHIFDVGRRRWWREETAGLAAAEYAARARDLLRIACIGAERAYWRAVGAEKRFRAAQPVDSPRDGRIGDPRGAPSPLAEDRSATRAELERLAGGFAPPGWTLSDGFPEDRPRPELARARDVALSSRPDLAAVASALASAKTQVRLAESASATDLGVGVQYQVEKEGREALGGRTEIVDRKLFGGATFTFPGHPPDRLAEAETARREGIKALTEAQSAVLIEIDEAFQRYDEALRHLESIERDRRGNAVARLDALAEWAEARCELEGAVGRPMNEFSK